MSGFFALFWERYIAWFTQRDVQRLVLGYEVVLLKGLVVGTVSRIHNVCVVCRKLDVHFVNFNLSL